MSDGAWLGEGVPSGVPAWDQAFINAGGTFDPAYTSIDWASIIGGASRLIGGAANVAVSGLNMAAPFLGLASSITAAGAQEAASYYQQGLLQVQAADTMRLAQLRTDQDRKYAALQAGRKLKAAEMLSMNYQIQGNSLLRNMERANAAVRARAAANGVAYGEGSAMAVQAANVGATYRDVGVSDLNALTARIMGDPEPGRAGR